MTKSPNTKYDISEFLTHTLGGIAEGYVLALAELTSIKEQQNKELKAQLNQASESINTLNQQHQQALQTLQHQHSLELNQVKQNNQKEIANIQQQAQHKINVIEKGVAQLLAQVTIPKQNLTDLIISSDRGSCVIDKFLINEGAYIESEQKLLTLTNGESLHWGLTGFLYKKLKKHGDSFQPNEAIMKFVNILPST